MPTDLSGQQLGWLDDFESWIESRKYKPSVVSPSYYQDEIEFTELNASKWNPVTEEGECGRYYIDVKLRFSY